MQTLLKPPVRDRLLLIALSLFFFVPFLGSVHLFDWDEINFAEAAREMIITGNYTRMQIDFQPFWEKPPLFIWLQAIAMHLFGINEFAARFVNAACGMATMLVVYGIGSRIYSRLFGLFWALAFLGSFFTHAFFKSGIIDPVFNLFIFLGIATVYQTTAVPARRSRARFAAAGAWIGLAVLTKGPVGYLIAALCIGVYWALSRQRDRFRFSELAIFTAGAAGVSLLFYGVETIWHGPWFMREFIKYHLRLLSTGDAGHGRPFYFHPLILLFGMFPASLLAIRAFFTRADDTIEQRDFKRWMVTLFWVVLILFSLVKTKTVLYSSLSWFPITFLAAYLMHAVATGAARWRARDSMVLTAAAVMISLALAAIPVMMLHKDRLIARIDDPFTAGTLSAAAGWTGYEALAAAVIAMAALLCVFLLMRGRPARGFATLLVVNALGIQLTMITYVGKIERHSQGGAISFYQDLAERDLYAESMFKSYADLFYLRKRPLDNPHAYDKEWLLTGPIDKPAYFVERVHKATGLANRYKLDVIETRGGFTLMRRMPTPETAPGLSSASAPNGEALGPAKTPDP
jgi:4-amino-4-deoxy-L-arabinose transferase-like glycosyltransferase